MAMVGTANPFSLRHFLNDGVIMRLSYRDEKTIEKSEIDLVGRMKKKGLSVREIADIMDLPESRIEFLISRFEIN